MCHILGNLPSEYDNVADNLASDEKKTLLSVTVTLKDNFERLKKAGKTESTGEKILLGYKAFSGNCRYCGKKGHKAKDCFKKRDDGKGNNIDHDKNGKDK